MFHSYIQNKGDCIYNHKKQLNKSSCTVATSNLLACSVIERILIISNKRCVIDCAMKLYY